MGYYLFNLEKYTFHQFLEELNVLLVYLVLFHRIKMLFICVFFYKVVKLEVLAILLLI